MGLQWKQKPFLMLLQVALRQAYLRPYNEGSARSCDTVSGDGVMVVVGLVIVVAG